MSNNIACWQYYFSGYDEENEQPKRGSNTKHIA